MALQGFVMHAALSRTRGSRSTHRRTCSSSLGLEATGRLDLCRTDYAGKVGLFGKKRPGETKNCGPQVLTAAAVRRASAAGMEASGARLQGLPPPPRSPRGDVVVSDPQ